MMLRTMTGQDLDQVLAIELAVQAYPWTRGNFSDALQHGYLCSVEEADGKIRGYAIAMPVLDEAELLNIAVASVQQRIGIGRALLQQVLAGARASNMRRVYLEVRASNDVALGLYRSAGFRQIGVRRGYYHVAGRSEDAITMACDLDGNNG